MALNSEDVTKIVEGRLNNSDFEIVNYNIVVNILQDETKKPLGFGGEYKTLSINVMTGTSKVKQNLCFFLKCMPQQDKKKADNLKTTQYVYKEYFFYVNILNELQRLVKYKLSPYCYLARPDDILALEDLSQAGYRMHTQETLDIAHCEVAMECLANLHAASIIYEETHSPPVRLDVKFDEIFRNDVRISYVGKCSASNVKSLQLLFDTHLLEHSKEDQENIIFLLQQRSLMYDTSAELKNVFSHKDLWINNMMFSYGADGCVQKMCLVDFQAAGYIPPGIDVLLLLHLTTSRDFRAAHQEHLLDLYYHYLSAQIHDAGLDCEVLLSREQFRASCAYALPKVFIAALNYALMIPKLGQSLQCGNEAEYIKKVFENNQHTRNTIRECILEIVQNCIWKEDSSRRVVFS